jgi:hypothetical protein
MATKDDNAATYKEYTEQCINYMKDKLHISYETDLIIDFTSRTGLFIDTVDQLCKLSLMYDKNPTHPDVKQLDFFNLDFEKYNKTYLSGLWFDYIHVIGCPQPNEIEESIATACKFAYSVSFILPKQKVPYLFPPSYKCVFHTDLNSSIVFQIWMKTDY